MSEYSTVLYEIEGNIAQITMNRPDNLNGITNTMMRELYETTGRAAEDPNVRVVVLSGAGKGFCPGADLNAYSSGEPQEPNKREYFHITSRLHEMPKVTIAAINGACAGAGLGWASACDLRYASSKATFNSAFLGVAISGDMAGPWLLPRIIGAGKARELFFRPGKFDAVKALDMGLVEAVFDDRDFKASIDSIAEEISGQAPLAIAEMKRNFVNAETTGLRDYIDLETERHSRTGASEDSKEAFIAFVEKRKPVFKGK